MIFRFSFAILLLLMSAAQAQSLLGGLMYDESLDQERVDKPLDVVRLVQSMTNQPLRVDASFPRSASMSDAERAWAERVEAANSLMEEKRFSEAIPALEDLLKERPDSIVVMQSLAGGYFSNKQFAKAEKLYGEVIEQQPLNYMALNNLAWLYATASDLSYRDGIAAKQNSKLALLRAPANFHIWSTLAEAYYISAEYEEALHSAQQALHFAEKTKADDKLIAYYHQQVEKARAAHLATSILE